MRADASRKVAVVLASDGLPSACSPNTIEGVVALARDGAKECPRCPPSLWAWSAPRRWTPPADLTAIAQAGGTARAFVVNTAADVSRDFQAALTAIRSTALACEYRLPTPSAGVLDYTRVNVQLTTAAGALEPSAMWWTRPAVIRNAGAGTTTCSGRAAPTSVITCPATCARLRAETGGQVDIVLGCQTVVE